MFMVQVKGKGRKVRSKGTLLGAPVIATRSKDATRGSWPYYYRNKDAPLLNACTYNDMCYAYLLFP